MWYAKVVFICDLDKFTSSLPHVLLISISDRTYKYIREKQTCFWAEEFQSVLVDTPDPGAELNYFSLKESELLSKKRLWEEKNNHVRLGSLAGQPVRWSRSSREGSVTFASCNPDVMNRLGRTHHLCSPSPNPKPSPHQEKTSGNWNPGVYHVVMSSCDFLCFTSEPRLPTSCAPPTWTLTLEALWGG